MKIFVSVKQAGKRKEYITRKELVLDKAPTNLRELISEVVSLNVNEFNNKISGPQIIMYLCDADIENQLKTGKVGFGEHWNPQAADVNKAVETALLAFTDGIFRVFIGDTEVESLDDDISLNENDVLTFIRFTMLAGRMW